MKYLHYEDGRNDLKISNLQEIFTTRENPGNKAIYKNYLQQEKKCTAEEVKQNIFTKEGIFSTSESKTFHKKMKMVVQIWRPSEIIRVRSALAT